jgi:hypothetical protein
MLIPHYQAFEPEVLGEVAQGLADISAPAALLIPHYQAFAPEVLGEAAARNADPALPGL